MTRRRDFLGIAAGVLATGAVTTGTKAEGPQIAPSITRDATGAWPRDIFPPGQHPALDYHGPSIPDEPGDAVLLDLIARFVALEHRINARFDEGGPLHIEDEHERGAANEPLQAHQEALLRRICATRAVTHEGTVAKAQMLHLWADDVVEGLDSEDWAERMVAGIVLDLLGASSAG